MLLLSRVNMHLVSQQQKPLGLRSFIRLLLNIYRSHGLLLFIVATLSPLLLFVGIFHINASAQDLRSLYTSTYR